MNILKMKTLKQILIGSCLVSASICASATTVTGNMTADNDFIVVVKQGNNQPNVVYRGVQNWRKVENFTFDVNSDPRSLKTCKISVIAWGDGSSKQGLAGILKADNTAYTGSGAFKAHQSSITSSGWAQNGGPNSSQIATLISAPTNNPYTFNNGTVISGTPPWGAMNFALANSVNTNLFRWIWSTSNLTKKTYSVFTIPCGKVVKAVEKPKDMKGEHFQCYNVEKGDMLKPESIMIEDQFGRTEAVLGKPVMLCNPSHKRHGRKNFKILRKERHLVCYNLLKQNRVKSHELKINNQFAPDDIVSGQREMFCVPSWKKHIGNAEPHPVPRKLNKKARKMHKLNKKIN